jgi:integrase
LKSQCITSYVTNIDGSNHASAKVYQLRLKSFDSFSSQNYNTTTDNLINSIKQGRQDPYQVLSGFVSYLQRNHSLSPTTLKQHIIIAKNFLEYYDVDIVPRKFKLKVKLPRTVRKDKQALSKKDIINILNYCSDVRLKTYVMLLAATGMRATEALSIRIKDIHFHSNPVKIFLRGEFTKTKVDRTVFLTDETAKQLSSWINYKYRTRRVSYYNDNGKSITTLRSPAKSEYDLLFAAYQSLNPSSIYVNLRNEFGKTLDRIGMGAKEEYILNHNSRKKHHRRRCITLHSCRRYVKSTISDLGYGDFSEYYIGHSSVSTYYRKTDKEKIELFRKIESHLTFLDYPTLERKGADVEAKVEHLENENQRLRHSDQLKEDALSTLSDQVIRLMVEVQELKKPRQS